MSVRSSLSLAVASLVAAPLVVAALAGPAEAKPRPKPPSPPRASESIRIDMGSPRHATIGGWGVDLKQKCYWDQGGCRSRAQLYAEDEQMAQRTFGSGRFDWVRITFRADSRGFEPDGSLKRDWYQPTIDAVANIREVDPDIEIWASRDTVTDCDPDTRPPPGTPTSCYDYDASLKAGDRPTGALLPEAYGAHAARYVDFMQSEGVPIDVLGLDNEPHNNEGDLDSARFLQTVETLEDELDGPLPELMMNCANNPNIPWLRNASPEVVDKLTYASMHSHPKRRSKLTAKAPGFANLARRKGLVPVNSELHWHRTPRQFDGVASSVRSTLDQLDWGYRGFAKWAYHPDDNATAPSWRMESQMTNALVTSTQGGRVVRTTDWDGADTLEGSVTTRAFRRSRLVQLWVVNDRFVGVARRALDVRGPNGARRTPRAVSYQRWTAKGDGMRRTTGRGDRARGVVRIGVPAKSVTLVRIWM